MDLFIDVTLFQLFVSKKNEPPHLIYDVNIYREMYANVAPYFYEYVTDS